jgi:Xaa-Pro dipeptidase
MPQTTEPSENVFRFRIEKLRDAMQEFGLKAIVLEPGPAMVYLTGVRWGRSERTFALVVTAEGELVYVLPAFEEMRARELIRGRGDVRAWQEDESPYARIVQSLKDRGITSGRVGLDGSARFFVFDGIRKLAPRIEIVGAEQALRAAGANSEPRRNQ